MKKPTPRQAQIRFNAIAKVIVERQQMRIDLLNNPPFQTAANAYGVSQHRRATTMNERCLNAALDKMMLFCLNNHTFPARVDALIDNHRAKRIPTRDWSK